MKHYLITGFVRALERLEPCAGKLACTVLRGAGSSNTVGLLDFAFIARQKRLTLEGDHFYADLVFYSIPLKAYIIIDVKTTELTHADLGQIMLYVNYFDREIVTKNDNPTIGLVLCTEKNTKMVEYLLGDNAKQIFASTYQFNLPTVEELEIELKKEIAQFKQLEKSNSTEEL